MIHWRLQRNNSLILLIPVLLGTAAFFIIAPINILNTSNILWLSYGDQLQRLLGWNYFRLTPWAIPLGLNPNYGIEFSSSIVYSDSIPFLAFLFKLFSGILPEPFQYFGIWTLFCFVMQALFGWQLASLISSCRLNQFFATALFVFAPPMLWFLEGETPLVSHFLILCALYLNLRANENHRKLFWFLLIFFSSLIHFYLLTMVIILWGASILNAKLIRNSISWRGLFQEIFYVIFIVLISLWQGGYFAIPIGSASSGEWGYSFGRMNILSIFNPYGWSYVLKEIPQSQMTYGDDFNYLGLGFIFLLGLSLIILITSKINLQEKIKRYPFLMAGAIALTIFALSNKVGFTYYDFNYPLPQIFLNAANIFHASGRMFWPVFYLLIFTIFYIINKGLSRKIVLLILLIALTLQITDTSAGWLPIRKKLNSYKTIESELKNSIWKFYPSKYQSLYLYPSKNRSIKWGTFGPYASFNHLNTTAVYLARFSQIKMDSLNARLSSELQNGQLNSSALYIIEDWKNYPSKLKWDPQTDLFARINEVNVLAPNWKTCIQCPQLDSSFEIKDFVPPVFLNEPILFTAFGKGRSSSFLLDNWSFSEAWGTWSNGTESSLRLPIPAGHPKTLTISARALVNGVHPSQDMKIMVNGVFVKQVHLTKNDENKITIPILENALSQGNMLIEFKFLNPIKPKDLDMGNDDRLLSIGIKSVVFN